MINHPNKTLAQLAMSKAIRNGIFVRPIACEYCQRKSRINGHHQDYGKPLVVDWLCSSCHKLVHSGKIVLAPRTATTTYKAKEVRESPMNNSKAAAALGRLGGKVTAQRGAQYYKDIAAKSHEARRANKAKRLAESKQEHK